jgi:hypothetical protein
MYDSTARTDYVKSEMEYRLGRIQSEFADRRQRRVLTRFRRGAHGATTVR